ncbi:MAG: MotE family protein [Lachnospiraceae bacterium]
MAKEEGTFSTEKKKLQDEKKKLKSEQKQQKKEAKKRAKEIAAQEAELSEDEEGGGFFTFLATLAIIVVWLAIVCIVIKLDVGGFGSNVLTPLLKNVPVVNKILPDAKEEDQAQLEDNGGYTSISDAVAQIKSLELQLEQAQSDSLKKDEEISNLKAEVARLQEFEDKQVEFQRIKTEFFENVVYAENGPGPEAYKEYYEAMDPSTAEYLYKQVVSQMEEDKDILNMAETYSGMKPKQAAAILESMSDNLNLAARILNAMSAEDRGKIMGEMSADVAAKLTKIMLPES